MPAAASPRYSTADPSIVVEPVELNEASLCVLLTNAPPFLSVSLTELFENA